MDQTHTDSARLLDRYRLLSQHARDIVLFVRPPDGRIVEANAAAVAAYGYCQDELLDLTIADLRDPATVPEINVQMEQAGDGGLTFETRHRRKDGTLFPVEVSSCGANVAGEWLLLSIIRDISDRKQVERVAQFLADAGSTLAAVVDPQSALQQVARLAVPALADWCVVDLADGDGQPRRVAVAHADPARDSQVRELTRHAPRADAPHGAGLVIRTGRSELVRDVTPDMIPAVVRDPAHQAALQALGMRSFLCVPLLSRGRAVGALSFVANESGRRYDERDLAAADELGRRAGVALDNARLYEELKEADRRKDEFLALLAHELRNPLAPIRNSLHALKVTGNDAAVAARARDMMERQVGHLVRLVDDLLDVSRIMRGKVDLRREEVELTAVVGRALETARPQIEAGRHELTVELPPDPVRLDADPVRLAQVFGNLLLNAAKYTEPGGRLRLTATMDGEQVAVRVRDTGIGIPADMLARVFDPFVQTDEARGKCQGGLGLGLALVRSLIELHGGTVAAASDGPGRGSEFTVRLPVTRNAELGVRNKAPSSFRTPSSEFRAAKRVLVVDDNRDAADSLAVLLRLKGHEVHVAYDGPAALAEAARFGPELVLLDLGMPGMDGYEVARRLRRMPEFEGGVLSALTGWGQEEDRRRTRAVGFDHHLVKPVDPAELAALLGRLASGAA